MASPVISFQPSLFGDDERIGFDPARGLERTWLDSESWVDFGPRWLHGASRLFEEVLAGREWAQRRRRVYDRVWPEPRLTSYWSLESGTPLLPAVLEDARRWLCARYGVTFDSAGFNLYRDGNDAVAWHRDHIRKEIEQPVVVLISLGEPRTLQLRPFGGRTTHRFPLGHGDLFVTGGRTQRTWEHCIARTARPQGARISIAFRHGMEARGYVDATS